MRAGRRGLWVLLVAAGLLAACSSSPSSTSLAHVWPSAAEARNCATASSGEWMGCLVLAHPSFADAPLSDIALPGAENAGTFNLDPQGFDTQAGSACTTITAGPSIGSAVAAPFSSTQDQTITQQLNDGVRWIDLQVGYNGNGQSSGGWRVVQNLYSAWPLSDYLDQVANWASQHPTEAVVVDLSTICYDHHPTPAEEKGLWANFATPSSEGGGRETMADVAASPSSLGSPMATATLGDLARAGHNVAVLIPSSARYWQTLAATDHVHPVRTAAPGHTAGGMTEVEHSDPTVAPTSTSQYAAANRALEKFPTAVSPTLGTLHGRGFYVSKLAYELGGAAATSQSAIFATFGGLIAANGPDPAWMSGLWSGAYGQILGAWAHATNVVLADGVESGGFSARVIELNGR